MTWMQTNLSASLLTAALVGTSALAQQDLAPNARVVPLPPGFTQIEGSVNKDAIPISEAVWAVFITTTQLEDAGIVDGASVLRQKGFDAAAATPLFQHMRSSVEVKKHNDLVRRGEFCEKRDQIATREALVTELQAMSRANDDELERLTNETSQIVDSAVLAMLTEEADQLRSSMSSVRIDYAAFFAAQPESAVADAVRRMCDRRIVQRWPGPVAVR